MKVWILALLAAATMTLAACGGDELPDVDPSDVLAAADSAGRALSGELSIQPDTAAKPSIYFDTLYRYYASARLIERDKRLDADSLSRAGVLAIDNVKDAPTRNHGKSILRAFLTRDSLRVVKRDSIASDLRRSMLRLLDSTAMDSVGKEDLIAKLTSRDRFEPVWRTQLDSLMRETVRIEFAILDFLDTAARRVRIEDVLKFTDGNDIAQYQAMTTRLGQLAMAQQGLVDRVTFGIPITPADSARQQVDSVAARPAQPKPTWPGAIRVQ
ncbi:MAG TPA: hypothetical protein VFH43_03335 [Candidatus Kapabacteria bacterium]|nr:hypothetical protein [Candidatus Kapabacteria bacterium]